MTADTVSNVPTPVPGPVSTATEKLGTELKGPAASLANENMDHSETGQRSHSSENVTGPVVNSNTANENQNSITNAQKKMVNIMYRLECFDMNFDQMPDLEQPDVPFDIQEARNKTHFLFLSDSGDSSPIFEVVTTVVARDIRYGVQLQGKSPQQPKSDEATPEDPPSLKDLEIHSVATSRLLIYSPLLLDIIREVAEYYPSQNLAGEVVTVREPYWVLLHHFSDLQSLHSRLVIEKKQKLQSADAPEAPVLEEKCNQLQLLLTFIQPYMDRIIRPLERKLQRPIPTVSFDMLWYILKPGIFAYCLHDDHWIGCVILSVKGKPADPDRRNKTGRHSTWQNALSRLRNEPVTWRIRIWLLGSSGHEVSRRFTKIKIEQYEGEQAVTSFPIVPREYWDKTDGGARRKQFEERGQRKIEMYKKENMQLEYDGESLEDKRRTYRGRIISDNCAGIQVYGLMPESKWVFAMPFIPKDKIDQTASPFKFANFEELDYRKPGFMTPDHYFLLSPSLPAFGLSTKTWYLLDVDRAHEAKGDDLPKNFMISDPNLEIVMALSHSQVVSGMAWSADFIKNKGEGIIILLHGPPGVGKTYTVECISLMTRRPLITLTIADIGTKEDKIEAELSKWFNLAERWKAVLLIDEADIFLERRKQTDLARNGVVSAFLRKMEYFSGLLFLTTNRVGHIDEAVLNRAHGIIGFNPLTDEKRKKIWEDFFDKLELERKGSIRIGKHAKKFVTENKRMLEIKWNGREIRNGLQTAIALAQFEASQDPNYKGDEIIVESEHFARVLNMSEKFNSYYNSIKGDTAEKRAATVYGRNDSFGTQNNVDM